MGYCTMDFTFFLIRAETATVPNVNRIAISNNRIVKIENNKVTFWWKDYKDRQSQKLMTLDAFEFIRRFLLHILPLNFYKMRYYGIWSSRNQKTKLKKCQEFLKKYIEKISEPIDWVQLFYELTGKNLSICPVCQTGRMIFYHIWGRKTE
ncbi:transposase [candidate division KSB1 bacterium]|nr:transposase [candidate division KSB1 bacterium]